MKRSQPHYKPCLLLVALDLIDRGAAHPAHVPLDLLIAGFAERLAAARLDGGDRWYMPAAHLAAEHTPFWELVKNGERVEGEPTPALRRRADAVRFLPELQVELATERQRIAARAAIYERMDLEGKPEDVQLRAAWPEDERDLLEADRAIERLETAAFQLDDPDAGIVTGQRSAVMRSSRFTVRVLRQYESRCALCRSRIRWCRACDIQAAHVKPRSLLGTDDCRNGLALCRTHHWAFDNFLWTANDDLKIRLQRPDEALGDDLASLARAVEDAGGTLALPARAELRPHPLALAWHRERFAASA